MSWDEFFDLERKESNAEGPHTAAFGVQKLFNTVSSVARELRDPPGLYHVELIPLQQAGTNIQIHIIWTAGCDRCALAVMKPKEIIYRHAGLRKTDVGLFLCHQPISVGEFNENFAESQFAARDVGSGDIYAFE